MSRQVQKYPHISLQTEVRCATVRKNYRENFKFKCHCFPYKKLSGLQKFWDPLLRYFWVKALRMILFGKFSYVIGLFVALQETSYKGHLPLTLQFPVSFFL